MRRLLDENPALLDDLALDKMRRVIDDQTDPRARRQVAERLAIAKRCHTSGALLEKFSGGMSHVWRAHDAITEMEWALKIPSDEIDATLYEREARLLLGIEPHPNVVLLQSIARYRGRPERSAARVNDVSVRA